MSYDVTLKDPVTKATILFDSPHRMRGGTYQLDETREAWLNITYNYSRWYNREGVFPDPLPLSGEYDGESARGIRFISGMTGAEAIPVLEAATEKIAAMEDLSPDEIEECKKEGCTDYWLPTKENALRPLYQLLAMARLRPDGVFAVN